jgi:hypothetical protein
MSHQGNAAHRIPVPLAIQHCLVPDRSSDEIRSNPRDTPRNAHPIRIPGPESRVAESPNPCPRHDARSTCRSVPFPNVPGEGWIVCIACTRFVRSAGERRFRISRIWAFERLSSVPNSARPFFVSVNCVRPASDRSGFLPIAAVDNASPQFCSGILDPDEAVLQEP